MKYEKPEVVALLPAIDVIEHPKNSTNTDNNQDASVAYEDWE